ncbi:plastidic triose-phosphate/phosphate translocator [Tribonema minus]|uniref:Plastidic triose-phosphate/phosphate translocator n=1 Tax=Tribonema minus TaxID=303371 RepID=A0A836CHH7_9STRA|nr:plastidic triose-phosphate/phosphate translocator [Tribonema minus]
MRVVSVIVLLAACVHACCASSWVPPTPVQRAALQARHAEIKAAPAAGGALAVAEEVRGGTASVAKTAKSPVMKRTESNLKYNLRIGMYFFLWYSLNVGYNYHNKKTLNMLAAPLTLSALQLVVGVVYVSLLWLLRLRAAPGLSMDNIKTLSPIGLCHAISHLSAVIGLGAGSVSFTHIVKAAEPFFTALFSAIFLKQYFPVPVYLSLVPVVAGVALASLKELNFSWTALCGAMGSNVAASSRAILAKRSMGRPKGTNMGAANLYGVLTILATAMLVPVAGVLEGPKFSAKWDAALLKGYSQDAITKHALLSGLYFYLYNEVAFLALDAVHPVVHAVGNTLKRVFIIASGVILFGNKITPLGMVGSSLAIVGVLIFSLVKEYYSRKKI